jgi:hypothetical protein
MRKYTSMPPLSYVQERLALSDDFPSGLVWIQTYQRHKTGEMAGKHSAHNGYYSVWLQNTQYVAHRLVYFLRTGEDPGAADVKHGEDNPERDNRKPLTLFLRKSGNRVRRSYVRNTVPGGMSHQQIAKLNGVQIIP